MRLKRTLRLALLTGIASTALIVGSGVPAQAATTVDTSGGQITVKEGGVVKSVVGFEIKSLTYPYGTSQAYKARSIRINVTSGVRDVALCNSWWGNDNANAHDFSSNLDFEIDSPPAGWSAPPSTCGPGTLGGAREFIGPNTNNNVTFYIFKSGDDGSGQECSDTGWSSQWAQCIQNNNPNVAELGPGGTGDTHPDINFGLYYSSAHTPTSWVDYTGVRDAVGGGTGQNVTFNF